MLAENDMNIFENLGVPELLCCLAEEAAELSQAALKLRRVLDPDKKNPTPKTLNECRRNMHEEIADCELILELLGFRDAECITIQKEIKKKKCERWKNRLADTVTKEE